MKTLIGLFAHPDDEAFGPVATLILEAQSGTHVHLICATAGEAGANPDNHIDLGIIRLEEWRESSRHIGARSTHYLGYTDGKLCNDDFHPIAHRIEKIIRQKAKELPTHQIELMSFDTTGLSGHLDHILMARVSCYLYHKLREEFPMRLRLFCLPKSAVPTPNCSWLYMDAGRERAEIDEVIDGRSVYETVDTVMRVHRTQREDYATHHAPRGERAAINHFIVCE